MNTNFINKNSQFKSIIFFFRLENLRNRKAVLKVRDSVDKAYKLYEKKALVMLNYFKTPEPLFVKSKKIKTRIREDEYGTSAEDEETKVISEESSRDEQYLKKIFNEIEFNENVDWKKLFNTITEKTESISEEKQLSFSEAESIESIEKSTVCYSVTDMEDNLSSEEEIET